MKRRIIRQGNREHGSYTVTLPASWVKESAIKQGDEVDVSVDGNSVIIRADATATDSFEVKFDARTWTITQIRRHLAQSYRSGADKITIIYVDKPTYHAKTLRNSTIRSEIEQVISTELLGMEIEKESKGVIEIKQFGEALENEFDGALKKIFHRLQDEVDEVIAALQSGQKDRLRSVWMYDRAVNKFCNFCMRILNKKRATNLRKTNELYSAIVQLELIGDLLYMIPLTALKLKINKVSRELFEKLDDFRDSLRLYIHYFYTGKEESFMELLQRRDKLYEAQKRITSADSRYVALFHNMLLCYELLVNLQDAVQAVKDQTPQ